MISQPYKIYGSIKRMFSSVKVGFGLMRKTLFPFYLLLMAIAVVPVLIDVSLKSLWPDMHWENEPFHSAVETVGAIVAILMASILLLTQKEEVRGSFYFLALGFLSMGFLDGFHSIFKPDNGFVFLHSIASLIGSF